MWPIPGISLIQPDGVPDLPRIGGRINLYIRRPALQDIRHNLTRPSFTSHAGLLRDRASRGAEYFRASRGSIGAFVLAAKLVTVVSRGSYLLTSRAWAATQIGDYDLDSSIHLAAFSAAVIRYGHHFPHALNLTNAIGVDPLLHEVRADGFSSPL
jgi:hypothetical protein